MGLSYETTKALFRLGHYAEILSKLDTSDEALSRLDLNHRLLVIRVLAHVDTRRASELAQKENSAAASAVVRSACELVIGLALRRDGAFEQAIAHLRRAVLLARESGDDHQLAWAYLHQFRLLAEVQPGDIALSVLHEARPHVTRSGDAHAAAFMHDSIALIEGSTGRLDDAQRHLRISASLLEEHPNAGLRQMLAVSSFCVAFLGCNFTAANRHLQDARRLLSTTGAEYVRTIIECNEGHVALITGRFDAAEERLRGMLARTSDAYSLLGSLDGLARLYLATGRLDRCAEALGQMDSLLATDAKLLSGFTSRWVAVTRVKLLLRNQLWEKAREAASKELENATELNDRHLISALGCLKAQASTRLGFLEEASSILVSTAETVSLLPERQAEFHHSVAAVLEHTSSPLAKVIRTRAHAIWNQQGNRLGPLENAAGDGFGEAETSSAHAQSKLQVAITTNTLASAIDLGHSPRLLGRELANAISVLGCSPNSSVIEARAKDSRSLNAQCSLPLGTEGGKELTLVSQIPDDPVKAILLADVLRIGRAALALDRARQEERSRAAIWPSTPVEEQAGALFLAAEMQTLLATVRRIAPTNVPVLITGETGTGKEVLARMIHAYSTRANATFLPFNCNGVPKDMLDSQLFGHRRGAFTGAVDHFPGVIRAATGATLFLDEIGEITLDVQPKLLRFLEAGEVHPIGETQPQRVDVRVIAATNADLDLLVTQGRFREDLFYRLNIVRLPVPPLRERRVEIPVLASHFLRKHAVECRKDDLRLAEETIEYLVLYRWPGNVRQLANEMRRMAALAEPGAVLMPEHLSPEIASSRRTIPASDRPLDPTELVVRVDQPMTAAVQHLERAMIQFALRHCSGRMEDTATLLGLSRKGLYLKRLRYGLEPAGSTGAEAP